MAELGGGEGKVTSGTPGGTDDPIRLGFAGRIRQDQWRDATESAAVQCAVRLADRQC